jgi:hypothetical protein
VQLLAPAVSTSLLDADEPLALEGLDVPMTICSAKALIVIGPDR